MEELQLKIKFRTINLKSIVLVPALSFIFLTMYYWDNQTIFLSVLRVVSNVFDGKWQSLFNGWSLPYGILIQLGAAIWSLPVYVLSKLGALEFTSAVARLWYKLFVLIFLLADTHLLGNIARKTGINNERTTWLKLYFLSSLIVVLPAVHVAQLEAVYLFFILLGIYYYMEGNYIKFLICFAVANPAKYMSLFVFIPLVLLKEKRYLFIIRDLLVGSLGILFDKAIKSVGYRIANTTEQNLVESASETLQAADNFVDNSITKLLSSNFSVFSLPVSLVFLGFFILCIWCYTRKNEKENNLINNAVYVSFLGFLLLFAFGAVTPYWIILLVPFELLLIFKGTDEMDRLLIPLEIAIAVAFIYTSLQSTSWIYGSEESFSMLLFSLVPGYTEGSHGYVHDFLTQHGIDGFSTVMCALMVAASASIAYFSYPREMKNEQETSNIYVQGWYWVRVVILYAWIFLNIYVVAMGKI